MEDCIVVDFQPFAMNQNILVYSGGECIEHIKAPIDRVVDIVHGLSNTYNINKIDLYGNTDYLSRFQAEIGTKFQSLEVNIKGR